jgi:hypothetical protein
MMAESLAPNRKITSAAKRASSVNQKRTLITDAAEKLFACNGIHHTTIVDIAQESVVNEDFHIPIFYDKGEFLGPSPRGLPEENSCRDHRPLSGDEWRGTQTEEAHVAPA